MRNLDRAAFRPEDLGRRIKARLSELPQPKPNVSPTHPPVEDRRASLAPTPDILSRAAFEALLEQWGQQMMNGSERSAIRIGKDLVAQTSEEMISRRFLQSMLHRMAVAGLGRCEVFHRLSSLAEMNRLGF